MDITEIRSALLLAAATQRTSTYDVNINNEIEKILQQQQSHKTVN